ncbi:MAG: SH3 domain-containing protein [Clostridia bacterium]|nr:SH3 domain-containing protein [Clostridia bacterium]
MKIAKITSIILSLVLVLGMATTFGSAMGEGKTNVLQQDDPMWSTYSYGKAGASSDLGTAACGVFSSINAIQYLTGHQFTYDEICAFADYAGPRFYVKGSGSKHEIVKGIADKFGKDYKYRVTETYEYVSTIPCKTSNLYPSTLNGMKTIWNKLKFELSAGRIAVGLVDGHFIALADYRASDDTVLILDSKADAELRGTTTLGDRKTMTELYYGSSEGHEMLKLRCCFNFLETLTGKYHVRTTSGDLILRSDSSSSGNIITTIPSGTLLNITEIKNNFGKTTYNGKTGWVSISYLVYSSESNSNDTASYGKYVVRTNGGNLNLRSSASSSGTVLTTIPNGTLVNITEIYNGFGKTTYKSYTGWISMSYLAKASTSTTNSEIPTISIPSSAGTYTVKTSGGNLNLRAIASSSSRILTSVPNGTKISVSEIYNGYGKVTYNSYTGWLSMGYLVKSVTSTDSEKPSTNVGTTSGNYVVKTSGGNLNMRSIASSSGSIVMTIPNGTKLSISEISNGYGKTRYNLCTGWVSMKYLSAVNDSTSADSDEPSTPTVDNQSNTYKVKTSGGSLNMRSVASTSGSVVLKIPNGTLLSVTSISNGFGKTTYNSCTGWVSMSYLEKYTVPASASNTTYTVTTSSGSLNLRSAPSTSSRILSSVPNGTKVNVIEISNGFAKVIYKSYVGWLSMTYLK